METDRVKKGKSAYTWPFWVAMASSFFLFFGFQAIFPVSPLYVIEVGGSSSDNGLATWIFALAALLTRSPSGLLADRWGRKPVLILGAILFSLGPALHTVVGSIPLLLVVKVVHGVGLACFSTAYQAFIADLVPAGRYGEGLGLASVASSLAMILAPLFGEWMVAAVDFRASFLSFSAIAVLGMVAVLVLPKQKRSFTGASDADSTGLRDALRHSGVRAGALWMALLGLPFGAFLTFLPLLVEGRGLGGAGWPLAVFALASTSARPIAGFAVDRWGSRGVTLLGLTLCGLASVGLAGVNNWWMLIGLAALFGGGFGGTSASLDAAVQAGAGELVRGSAAALQYTAFDTLVGFGSLGLGFVANLTDYGVMYGLVSGIVFLGMLIGGLATAKAVS
jgi:MFS family permease